MPESFSFSTPEIMKKTTYRKEMKKKKGKLRDINQTNVFLGSFMDYEDTSKIILSSETSSSLPL